MAEQPPDDQASAWEADLVRKGEQADPSESGTTYRLSSPNPLERSPVPVTSVPAIEPVGPRRVASKDSARWPLIGYNVLIFVTSVCVMTLELTASRIIGKHLGASLYTWTSVIGVILAGITIGNWLGGWLSDRYDRYRSLGWMYLLSSISSAGVLYLEQMISYLDRPTHVSWPLWVLAVVSFLFLFPAIALGATSPLIASLALSRSNRLGATVGNVYAWGACGSIAGTFLTGFFLVDVLGSRAIIGVVSGTLAILAVLMAGRRNVFRAVVLCGWMQLFLFTWLVSSATYESCGNTGAAFSRGFNRFFGDADGSRELEWYQAAGNIGQKLHELGLVAGLRDDQIGRYWDESQYSYIQVSSSRQEGRDVKILRLDKLIHSYYDPAEPTALHYDYEQIYAAVTKLATGLLEETSSVHVPDFPEWESIRVRLPGRVAFDPETRQLSARGVDAQTVDELLDLAQDSDYWYAVDQLSIVTSQPEWGGLESQTLERLPDGVQIPDDLSGIVRYDASLRLLNAYQPVTPEIRDRLIRLSPRSPWFTAVNELRRQSGRISSFFIGGGGYIFPRWVAHEYPGSTRIDVAELDPAVRTAVVEQLGMTPKDEERIVTTVGDARNVVDDRLKENRKLVAQGAAPVLYEFIYGDAFNDFSVPWHLTTLEFQQKLRDLLTPHGIVQMNLIDIYPRVEFPGKPRGQATLVYKNFLPRGLMKQADFPSNQFVPVLSKFGRIEVNCRTAAEFEVKASEVLSSHQQKILLDLDRSNTAWRQFVFDLVTKTRESDPYAGQVPSSLLPASVANEEWFVAKDFPAFELQQIESDKFSLGYRGLMTDAARSRLIELAPEDSDWREAINELQKRSLETEAGQFLGRFTYTAAQVFPNIYVFCTTANRVSVQRDTFVIVCARRPLDMKRLEATGLWSGQPFAVQQTNEDAVIIYEGHMEPLLALARGQTLTDDFAPVENLLLPIFADQ